MIPAQVLGRLLGRITVLLVEDSPDDAQLTVLALEDAGLDVGVTTVDGEAAFVAALLEGPDVVISDLELPGFDGRRALAIRAELAPETPFIVVSGTITDAQASEVLQLGATDYLIKDRTERLTSAVLRCIDSRRTLEARRAAERASAAVAARWETLISSDSDIVAVVDENVRLIYANDALVRLLGHEPDDVLGRNVLDFVHPEDIETTTAAVSEALARDGVGVPVIVRLATAAGNYRYVETIGNNRLHDPNICGLVVNGRDVTDRIIAEQLLAAEVEILERIAFDDPPDKVFELIANVVEGGGEAFSVEFVFASEHFTYRFGHEPASDDIPESHTLVADGTSLGSMTLWRPLGCAPAPLSSLRTSSACHLAVVAANSQISRARLLHQALHDPLTGLGNRSLFLRHLDKALTTSVSTTVLMIDVDRLKWINEGLGHEFGDHVLVTLADRFSACLTGTDVLARVGGDEFALLATPIPNEHDEANLAERLLSSAREPIVLGEAQFTTSVSIGIAPHGESESSAEMLGNADAALDTAKRQGRDRAILANPASRGMVAERLVVERDLRVGIGRGELVCHLQPLINLASGAVSGAEALVRWQHPSRGLLGPSHFMPFAAQSNLIEAVDSWMLEAACASYAELGVPAAVAISVNASVRDLVAGDFAGRILATIERHHLPPEAIALEVTESDALSDLHAVRANLSKLHSSGVAIHLDDFGTGYSSLSYLHQLPIDAIKIDQSFVQEMVTNADIRALVEAITAMARALRLTTIAEGVETQDQADLLAEMKVDYAQGYFYCKPCSLADLRQWIADRPPLGQARAKSPAGATL